MRVEDTATASTSLVALALTCLLSGCTTRSGVIAFLPKDKHEYAAQMELMTAPDEPNSATVQIVGRRHKSSRLYVDMASVSKNDHVAKSVATIAMNVGLRSPSDLIGIASQNPDCTIRAISLPQGTSWHAPSPIVHCGNNVIVYLFTIPCEVLPSQCEDNQIELLEVGWNHVGKAAHATVHRLSAALK